MPDFNQKLIREAISLNRLSDAIKIIKDFLEEIKDDLFLSELTIIESDLNTIKNPKGKSEVEMVKYNRLKLAILELSQKIRDYENSEYRQKLISQNAENINGINNKINKLELETLKAKENIKKSVHLNFYVKQEQINRLGDCWATIYIIEKKFLNIQEEIFLTSKKRSQSSKDSPREEIDLREAVEQMFTELEDSIDKEADLYNDLHLSDKEHEYFSTLLQELYKEYQNSDLVLEKNRYWLGNELYQAARNYHNCFPMYFKAFNQKNYNECKQCYLDMHATKEYVSQQVLKIQEEIGL